MRSFCMQDAYANNTIVQFSNGAVYSVHSKTQNIESAGCRLREESSIKRTFTCSYARHGCHKFHESVPRIPKSAWKTLCKHETLEQDFKIRKRLYLFILARINMLDLIDIIGVPASKGKLKL